MSNNPAYQPINPNSGALPAGVIVETEQQPSGAQRQLIKIAESIDLVTTRADDLYNDAFQRLRVSQTDQRFDSEFTYDKAPLLFDDISAGGGSATFDGNARDVVIATGATGGRVIKSGYVSGGQAGNRGMATPSLTSKIPLGVTAAGVGDILAICFVKDSATNASASASLVFEEIR